ncbi:MAG: hypothetical protein EOL95_08150 [Bacteroidia bacterium]|nr:hypothetical protein [Bacteroidia bacterium]
MKPARLSILVLLFMAAEIILAAKPALPVITKFRYLPNIVTRKKEYTVTKTVASKDKLTVYLEDEFSNLIFREDMLPDVYDSLRAQLPQEYASHELSIISRNKYIEEFVPNAFRKNLPIDKSRMPNYKSGVSIVKKESQLLFPTQGLTDRNIALWDSHGLYFNYTLNRWEWQRPRLFGTVEDLLTASVVIPFLVPMLENSGAQVFMPRERDIQIEELYLSKTKTSSDTAVFTGTVNRAGTYRIKIWYGKETKASGVILCKIEHAGVINNYQINANMGAGTWIDVDGLYFNKDVRVSFVMSGKDDALCVDSVKIGGGISHFGNGYPRFAEAARYNLQQAGLPDSILYDQKPGYKSDYYDDIYSRSKWVNFLAGGSPVYPSYPGLKIPIDAVLAVHTDAFTIGADSVVGTLLVCTSDSVYPSGYSKMAGHDLADRIRTQIIDDVSRSKCKNWSSRGIWHQKYVETLVPAVPSVIIELFSHLNYQDMLYGLQPQFKFLLARSIYKGTLKFLAEQNGQSYVVQPLPVKSFGAELKDDSVSLSWEPVSDSLEETAYPVRYILYTRKNDGSFDNGQIVKSNTMSLPIMPDTIYSFKVTASNEGGESFPSEILSVCHKSKSNGVVMIINGFDRVGGPQTFDCGSQGGFLYDRDFGVPYMYDIAYTGSQIEFDKSVSYQSNDYPGFGASKSNYETQVIAGNTFDYAYVHGKAIYDNNYSFVSSSKDAVMDGNINLSRYDVLDVIMGKQRTIDGYELYPNKLQSVLTQYIKKANKKIIITGAYIGTESCLFTEKALRYKLRAPWASTNGVIVTPNNESIFTLQMQANARQYFLQNVDALQQMDKIAEVLLRYDENKVSAALGFNRNYKVVAAGFPIEALTSDSQRTEIMRLFLNY